jgi:hypothetical protein
VTKRHETDRQRAERYHRNGLRVFNVVGFVLWLAAALYLAGEVAKLVGGS